MSVTALILSIFAVLIAAGSLTVSMWHASISSKRLALHRRARVAIDLVGIQDHRDRYDVEVMLTNVGDAHARHVEVWLEDERGTQISDSHRLRAPLIAGQEGALVTLQVPHCSARTLFAVRKYRDEDGEHRDRSAQVIDLPLDIRERS